MIKAKNTGELTIVGADLYNLKSILHDCMMRAEITRSHRDNLYRIVDAVKFATEGMQPQEKEF